MKILFIYDIIYILIVLYHHAMWLLKQKIKSVNVRKEKTILFEPIFIIKNDILAPLKCVHINKIILRVICTHIKNI